MARAKQREQYGNGSVTPVMIPKKDKSGNPIIGADGKPVKVQEKNKKGEPVWRICLSLGTEQYVDKNGNLRKRQRKVQKRFGGSLKQAREYAKSLSDDYERVDLDFARDNYSSLCKEWQTMPYKCSEKQRAQYILHLGYLAPFLDTKPLIDLKQADIEAALNGVRESRSLSDATYNKILAIVSRVFEFAVNHDYIVRNPCRNIEPRESASAEKRHALSEEDAARLCRKLDEAETAAYSDFYAKEKRQADLGNTFGRSAVRNLHTLSCIMCVRILLATGMRRGEALALQWQSVDLERGTIRVCQSINERDELKSPKTSNGIRNMFIDAHTLEHMRVWHDFQRRYLHLINVEGVGLSQGPETAVFTSDNGTFINVSNFAHWWVSFRKTNGFDALLIHELRHSQITILLGNLIDINEVQTRVGHSRPSSVTLRYLHELPARDSASAETMGRVLYETSVENDNRGGVLRLQKTA